MSFRDVLNQIRNRVDGTLAVSLIGLDGISVESISDSGVELEAMGAEFGGLIKGLSKKELDTGEVLQFSLVTERFVVIVSAITPEYYMLLVMKPDGNYGRARFELARAKELLREELL